VSFFSVIPFTSEIILFLIGLMSLFLTIKIVEITYAFINDFKQQSNNEEPTTKLSSTERIELAIYSYFEVIINFAVINFSFTTIYGSGLKPSDCASSEIFTTFYDFLYYSGVTITTLGYGDLTPINPILKLLSVAEVLVGFVLVLLAIGIYMSKKN